MPREFRTRLIAEAWWELLRYDLVYAVCGFRGIHRGLANHPIGELWGNKDCESTICQAFVLASSLYWKPLLCLQRSVALARLLRKRRFGAEVVIAYIPQPFFSHAWVEIDGRILNDSPIKKERLNVLQRI
jgi:hypothetical protein